jgi:four helix bundle protein
MDENLFKQRTKQLALRIIKLVEALPKNRTADVLGRQLIRSGTSIGANIEQRVAASPPPM